MNLSDLVYAFKNDYEIQCILKGVAPIPFRFRQIALMLSKTVSDLQKRLGIIEVSVSLTSVNGTATYSISSSFMNPKTVLYDSNPLEKKSTQWIKEQYAMTGTPEFYAIQYENNTAKLYLYPTPSASGDSVIVQSNYNYNLYSPTETTQNFGTFDGTTFSGNTVLPSQYDNALLLGMMAQIFPDFETKYREEVSLLRVKQYNGEKFTYDFGGEKETKGGGLSYSQGVTEMDIDQPWKEIRFEFAYGVAIDSSNAKYVRGWEAQPSASDNGSVITITSANSEFNSSTLVEKNNDAVDVNRTSTSTITVNYFGNNFGTITIIIKVW